jgi:hypothetical protein
MFANPATFGLSNRSSGSLDIPQIPATEASRGSLTSGADGQHGPVDDFWLGVTATIGSLVGTYFRNLVATASAQTAISSITLPVPAIADVVGDQARAEPVALQVPAVLDEIRQLTGLNKTRIAEDLFGVTKQAYNAWERGLNISDQNLARVLETREVLIRAVARHPGAPNLRVWLQTPRGARAERPGDLLKAGEFGKARMLAISAAPPREHPVADWVLRSTPDPWTSDQLRWRSRQAIEDQPLPTADDD